MTATAGAEARVLLARLAASAPEADDPVLRLILREIGVRAAVELARQAA
ncbi:MAG: flagellar assembly protein FliX [Rhodospirillales bacterium]